MSEPSDSTPQQSVPPLQPPEDWTPVEKGLWDAFRLGEWYDLRTGIPEQDDPAADHFWGPERTVRAEAMAKLLLDGPPAVSGRVACVKLSGAQISGELQLSGGTVVPYVELRDCRFEQVVMVSECRFTTVRMVHCALPRLEASRLHTTGDLHLPQCTVEGGIRLTDAHIGTDLLLNQLTVRRDRHGRAVAADGLNVAQDVEAELMEATGEISLRSARIGGRLSLRGSVLHNPHGRYALNAARVQVEHTLYLSAGYVDSGGSSGTPPLGVRTRRFTCEGGLRLDDGRFGNAVIINQARFRLTDSQQLSLRRVQTPELRLTLDEPPTGLISLAGARVGNLTDVRTCWPQTAGIDLTGFTYGSLSPEGPFPLRERIAWLAAATPEYSPEPYEHLAAALRASGEDAEAREVLLAKQRRRRETLPLAGQAWGYLQDLMVGYGYRPGRAAVWMALLWAVGAVFFSLHPRPAPTDAGAYPYWNPALFALDLLLPVVNLGQDNAWRLTGYPQWAAAVLTMLGWILATTVAAGASRMLRRG